MLIARIQVYLTYSNMIIHGIFPLLFLVIVNSKIYFRWHIFHLRWYHIFVAVVLNKPHDLLTSATFKIASLLPDIYSNFQNPFPLPSPAGERGTPYAGLHFLLSENKYNLQCSDSLESVSTYSSLEPPRLAWPLLQVSLDGGVICIYIFNRNKMSFSYLLS